MLRTLRIPKSSSRFTPSCHAPTLRRAFVTVQTLADGFLDLAVAIPYPQSFPPYSSTIILLAISSRIFFTVPASIWAKRREWKMEELVVPALQRSKPEMYAKVFKQMQQEKVRGTKESIQKEHARRSSQELLVLQKKLAKQHRCSPWPTALVPIASQLPLFVGITYLLRYLSVDPTPFAVESFLSLSNLTSPDPTFALPIALGIITLANVESYKWFQTDLQAMRDEKHAEIQRRQRAEGRIVTSWVAIFRTAMRLATPVRIIVAGVMPGSVVIYWVTSAAFGLVQNWVFDWWYKSRKQRPRSGSSTSPPTKV